MTPRHLRFGAAGLLALAGGGLVLVLSGSSGSEGRDALLAPTDVVQAEPSETESPRATAEPSPSGTISPSASVTSTPSPARAVQTDTPSVTATPSPTRLTTSAPKPSPRPTNTGPGGFSGLSGPLPCSYRPAACPYPGTTQAVSGGPDEVTATVLGPGRVRVTWKPWAVKAEPPVVGFVLTVVKGASDSSRVVRQVRFGLASRAAVLDDLPEGTLLAVNVQELNAAGLSPGFVQEFTTPVTPTMTPSPTATPSATLTPEP